MSKNFRSAVLDRRSMHKLSKDVSISEEKILEIVENAVKHTPTAMNSQSGRAVVLFGEHHETLWDSTKETLRKMVPEQVFKMTEVKIDSFRNGYGSVLFFEDQNVIEGLQEKFPLYKDNFPLWSQNASGMLQYIVWTELEAEGLGASLQHYNPLIDSDVQKQWNIPSNWKLCAQMPFGAPVEQPQEKEFLPMEDRMIVYK